MLNDFNNAGITGGAHPIEDYSTADFDNVLRINLKSIFLGMKYELPLMKRGGCGAICNTASVAALTGPGGMCAYAASKHGVLGLTRVAAMLVKNSSKAWRDLSVRVGPLSQARTLQGISPARPAIH